MEGRRDFAVVAAVMTALALVTYWPLLSGRLPGGDLSDTLHQGYPFLSFTEDALREGRIPHWNPYVYCGIPFYSSFSAPVFYPVRGLSILLGGAEASVRILYPLHMVLAGLSAWLLLGALGVSRGGRLVGALAFAAGAWANTLFYAGHGSKVISWSWTPMLLYGTERWLRTGRLWFLALAGLSLGMQGLSSHPQMMLYSMIGTVLWSVSALLRKPGAALLARAAAGCAGAALVGGAVAAVQLLPGWDFSRTSTRADDLPREQAASYSLPPEESLVMAFPHLFGYRHGFPDSYVEGAPVYWGRLGLRLSSEFVGVTALLLAITALALRRPGSGSLALLAAAGLLLSWGGHLPLYDLLYGLAPVFRKLRAPHMAAFLTTTGLALLAGPGFDAFTARASGSRRSWRPYAFAAAACLLLWTVSRPLLDALQAGWWERAGADPGGFGRLVGERAGMAAGDFLHAALFAGLAACVAFAVSRRRLGAYQAAWITSGLLALELVPVDRDFQVYLPQDRIEDVLPEVPGLAEAVGGGRLFPGGNRFAAQGIRSVTGYHAARPQAVDAMLSSIEEGGLPALRAACCTVLQDGGALYAWAEVAEAAAAQGTGSLPSEPLPRAFLPRGWELGEDRLHMPDSTTFLEEDPGVPREPAGGTARIVLDRPELVEVSVDAGGPSLLVLADTWDPRWTAEVDGEPAAILRANGWMRAVAVPGGSSTVTFRWVDPFFRKGLALSAAALAAVAAAGLAELLRRRRNVAGRA